MMGDEFVSRLRQHILDVIEYRRRVVLDSSEDHDVLAGAASLPYDVSAEIARLYAIEEAVEWWQKNDQAVEVRSDFHGGWIVLYLSESAQRWEKIAQAGTLPEAVVAARAKIGKAGGE